ncbi:MAG: S16 family serine protease [bacterium]|nr:S16 family serine protease [bacterium]
MAIALISLLTKQKIKQKIAMTGEIMLRGKILPVSGIKEKILAARRAGVKQVVLPKKNENDLVEVIKNDMRFHLVDKVDEVVELIFFNKK